MLQKERNRNVLRILGKLRAKGVPSPKVVDFEEESMQLGPDTIASPLDPLGQKKKLLDDEEAVSGDEEETTDY